LQRQDFVLTATADAEEKINFIITFNCIICLAKENSLSVFESFPETVLENPN